MNHFMMHCDLKHFLQCVELIKLLMPKFVTVEEVPDFLSKTMLKDYLKGKGTGSGTVRLGLYFFLSTISAV